MSFFGLPKKDVRKDDQRELVSEFQALKFRLPARGPPLPDVCDFIFNGRHQSEREAT